MSRLCNRRAVLAAGAAVCLAPRALAQSPAEPAFPVRLAIGAEKRAQVSEIYDPAYVPLAYPGGDVADDRGVCSDTVIRAFRYAGVDLQVEVHEDMRAHFSAYPALWGLRKPDRNIDHRRVPNLETLFRRRGGAMTVSQSAADYHPGDIISWRLAGSGLPHIGVVTRRRRGAQPLIAHNIGAGTREEPCLFDWPIRGWFRFGSWA